MPSTVFCTMVAPLWAVSAAWLAPSLAARAAFGHLDRGLGDVRARLRVELVGGGVEAVDARADLLHGRGLLRGALGDLRGGLRGLVGGLGRLLGGAGQLVLSDNEVGGGFAGAADDLAQVLDHRAQGVAEPVLVGARLDADGEVAVGDAVGGRRHLVDVGDHLAEGVGHVADLVLAGDFDVLLEVAAGDADRGAAHLVDAAGDGAREEEGDHRAGGDGEHGAPEHDLLQHAGGGLAVGATDLEEPLLLADRIREDRAHAVEVSLAFTAGLERDDVGAGHGTGGDLVSEGDTGLGDLGLPGGGPLLEVLPACDLCGVVGSEGLQRCLGSACTPHGPRCRGRGTHPAR